MQFEVLSSVSEFFRRVLQWLSRKLPTSTCLVQIRIESVKDMKNSEASEPSEHRASRQQDRASRYRFQVFTPLEYGMCGLNEEQCKEKYGDDGYTSYTKEGNGSAPGFLWGLGCFLQGPGGQQEHPRRGFPRPGPERRRNHPGSGTRHEGQRDEEPTGRLRWDPPHTRRDHDHALWTEDRRRRVRILSCVKGRCPGWEVATSQPVASRDIFRKS
eukprot:s3515_g5.t1